MIRREVRLPVYWLAVGILIAVVSPIASLLVSRSIAIQNANRLIKQQQLSQQAQAKAVIETACDLFRSQLEAYDETPPPSTAGKNVQDAWLTEYRLYNCQPAR